MALSSDELLERSKGLRKEKRFQEALVVAQACTQSAPTDPDAWWQVALNRCSLRDHKNAVTALRKTVELAPEFSAGWSRLGTVLLALDEDDDAREAMQTALNLDEDNAEALEAMAQFLAGDDDRDQDDEEISILKQIEEISFLDDSQKHRLAGLYYRNESLHEAIKYWRETFAESADHATAYNLGLAYNHPQVSQDADAVDMWRLALTLSPNYELATRKLGNVLPRMLKLAAEARSHGGTLLPREQWFDGYINPFQLLNVPSSVSHGEIDAKLVQKLKKVLLQEIDLEDGRLHWVPDLHIDRSRAIGVCEDLSSEEKSMRHWAVFRDKPLLDFLNRGSHHHFLVDERKSPLETIELVWGSGDADFQAWLSPFFAPQFDRVLSRAISSGDAVITECLLDGRRWVTPSWSDRCFENTQRIVNRLIQPLRDAGKSASEVRPTIPGLERLLGASKVIEFLNLLPAFFEAYQNEAVHLIRGIAVTAFNEHDDIDLSRKIIDYAHKFKFRSADANRQIEADIKVIEDLIKKERRHEQKLSRGDEAWHITKEGVRKGDVFIPANEVRSVRWGAVITRDSTGAKYDFLLHFESTSGRSVKFSWITLADSEKSQEYFYGLIAAAQNYVFPFLVPRAIEELESGRSFTIGTCSVRDSGVHFEVKGWVFSKQQFVPWNRLEVSIENGEVVVSDATSQKTRTTFSLRDTANAPLLSILARIKNNKEN